VISAGSNSQNLKYHWIASSGFKDKGARNQLFI